MSQIQVFGSNLSAVVLKKLSDMSGIPVSPDGSGDINLIVGPGIYTQSDPSSNSIIIGRAEFIVGTGTTTDETPIVISTFDMGPDPAVYTVKGTISIFDKTTPNGAGDFFSAAFLTDGTSGDLIDVMYGTRFSKTALANAKFSIGVSENFYYRLRASGTDATATNYTRQKVYANGSSVTGARFTSQSYAGGEFITNTTRNGMQIHIYGPNLAQPTAFRSVTGLGDSGAALEDFASTHSLSTAYDGTTVLITQAFTGTVRVFGYRCVS